MCHPREKAKIDLEPKEPFDVGEDGRLLCGTEAHSLQTEHECGQDIVDSAC
jgi:hypothetical protein